MKKKKAAEDKLRHKQESENRARQELLSFLEPLQLEELVEKFMDEHITLVKKKKEKANVGN